MATLKYWDAGTSQYVALAAAIGPAGPQGPQGVGVVPTGVVEMFAGRTTVVPTGWLFCDGSAVSRTTYAALFGVIDTVYGAGDGSTTFNLPDLRSRAPIGAAPGGVPGLTQRALATSGGEENHTLSIAELAQHSHSNNTGTESVYHQHQPISGANVTGYVISSSLGLSASGDFHATYTTANTGNQNALHVHNIPLDGSNYGHNNMQPWLAVNYIIKT
jgi:microcystin-dependent protein